MTLIQQLMVRMFQIEHLGWNLPEEENALLRLTRAVVEECGEALVRQVIDDPEDQGMCIALLRVGHMGSMVLSTEYGTFQNLDDLRRTVPPGHTTRVYVVDRDGKDVFDWCVSICPLVASP